LTVVSVAVDAGARAACASGAEIGACGFPFPPHALSASAQSATANEEDDRAEAMTISNR
jgi:hypothetical protein